eukprot:m.147616 g.147616  ORF g.147616 m.147616 type:complete len:1001 (+) comp16829_c1_seq5:625-3627(+)
MRTCLHTSTPSSLSCHGGGREEELRLHVLWAGVRLLAASADERALEAGVCGAGTRVGADRARRRLLVHGDHLRLLGLSLSLLLGLLLGLMLLLLEELLLHHHLLQLQIPQLRRVHHREALHALHSLHAHVHRQGACTQAEAWHAWGGNRHGAKGQAAKGRHRSRGVAPTACACTSSASSSSGSGGGGADGGANGGAGNGSNLMLNNPGLLSGQAYGMNTQQAQMQQLMQQFQLQQQLMQLQFMQQQQQLQQQQLQEQQLLQHQNSFQSDVSTMSASEPRFAKLLEPVNRTVMASWNARAAHLWLLSISVPENYADLLLKHGVTGHDLETADGAALEQLGVDDGEVREFILEKVFRQQRREAAARNRSPSVHSHDERPVDRQISREISYARSDSTFSNGEAASTSTSHAQVLMTAGTNGHSASANGSGGGGGGGGGGSNNGSSSSLTAATLARSSARGDDTSPVRQLRKRGTGGVGGVGGGVGGGNGSQNQIFIPQQYLRSVSYDGLLSSQSRMPNITLQDMDGYSSSNSVSGSAASTPSHPATSNFTIGNAHAHAAGASNLHDPITMTPGNTGNMLPHANPADGQYILATGHGHGHEVTLTADDMSGAVQDESGAAEDEVFVDLIGNVFGVKPGHGLVVLNHAGIRILQRAGSGRFGAVFRAIWYQPDDNIEKVVAAKILRCLENDSDNFRTTVEREIRFLSCIDHPNIVKLVGAATMDDIIVATEYAEGGSLYDFLKRKERDYDWMWVHRIASEICAGMCYLVEQHIIHRDLKSQNILLACASTATSPLSDNMDPRNFRAQICDFGLSRHCDHLTNMTGTPGTPAWMAPEIIQSQPSDEKCDVYSYSIVLWELVTRLTPWAGMEPAQIMFAVVAYSRRPPIPDHCPPFFKNLMEQCWTQNPTNRLRFHEIYEILKNEDVGYGLPENESLMRTQHSWHSEIASKLESFKDKELKFNEKERRLEEIRDNIQNLLDNNNKQSLVPLQESHILNRRKNKSSRW